jgi:hypothetical protein
MNMNKGKMPKFDYKSGNPWLAFDERDEYEDCISGNRQGLEALRDAVSAALEKKASNLDFHYSQVRGVVLVEGDPRETAKTKNTWKDAVAALFSLLLAATVVILGFAAVLFVFKFVKKLILG